MLFSCLLPCFYCIVLHATNKREEEPIPSKIRSPSSARYAPYRVSALISKDSIASTTIMIRKNLIKCNLIRVYKSGKVLFDEYMASFRPETETCPYCGAKGACRIFAYYKRYLIDFVDGHPVVEQIRVLRVICSCGATHAILFDPVIPYEQHSLLFILRVLAEHFMHRLTVEKICEVFDICLSTFHRWKKLFEANRRAWQGTLASIETSLAEALCMIENQEPFAIFAQGFYRLTGMSFLQSHKNPAPYQRRIRLPDTDFP